MVTVKSSQYTDAALSFVLFHAALATDNVM